MQRVRRRLRHVPAARSLRTAALGTLDAVDGALGRGDPLRPPRRLQSVGDGDFRAVGDALLEQMVAVASLRPDARVLDVGCGTGRTAVPLADYLKAGSYDGFDISRPAIRWCQNAITSRHPKFAFRVLDVANTHYNPDGQLDAARVAFPYADDAFDFALATSVFTHMLPRGFFNYAAELARVLAPGATFFGTFLLLNPHSVSALESNSAEIELPAVLRDEQAGIGYRVMDPRSPETAIAFTECDVVAQLTRVGFEVPIVHPGRWSGHTDGVLYQDTVIARRPT